MILAVAKGPKEINPDSLREALEFEFNLPHPNGKRLGLAEKAKKSFSEKLGMKL